MLFETWREERGEWPQLAGRDGVLLVGRSAGTAED